MVTLLLRILIIALVLGAAACARDVDPEATLRRAERSFADGMLGDALTEVRTVLWAEPERPEALLLLAAIHHRLGDSRAAAQALAKAMELGVQTAEARELRAELQLANGELAALRESIASGELGDLPPAAVERLLAEALLGLGEHGEAEQRLGRLLETSPDDYAARELLARVLLAKGDSAAALETIDAALAANSRFARALITRGVVLQVRGSRSAASDAFGRALELVDADADPTLYVRALAGRTEEQIALGALDDARAGVEALERVVPATSSLLYWLRARIAMRSGDYQEAVINAQQLLAQQPQHVDAQLLLATAYLRRGLLGQAELHLQRVIVAHPDHLAARKLLAETLLEQGRPQQAADILAEASAPYDAQMLVLLGRALAVAGRVDEAPAALGRSLDLTEADAPVRFQLALALIAAGRYEESRALLESMIAADAGAVAARIGLANLEWLRGDAEAAAAELDAALAERPDDPLVLAAQGHVALVAGDLHRAAQWVERAEQAAPDSAVVLGLRAALALAGGDEEAALRAADRIVEREPELALGHRLQGGIALRIGRVDEAVRALERATQLEPRSPETHLLLARAHLAGQERARAEQALDAALALRPLWLPAAELKARLLGVTARTEEALSLAADLAAANPGRPEPELLRGDLLAAARRTEEADSAYRRALTNGAGEAGALRLFQMGVRSGAPQPEQPLREWLARDPQAAGARYALAQHYQATGALAGAREQYERLAEIQPENPIVLNNLAWVLHELGDPEHLTAARRAHELAPDNGAITDTLGWLLLAADDPTALPLLERAAEQAPEIPEIRYHLAAALVRHGETGRAREILDSILRSGADFSSRGEAEALRSDLARPER